MASELPGEWLRPYLVLVLLAAGIAALQYWINTR